MQFSFLNPFLKGEDSEGRTAGLAPKVGLMLRKGDVGHNNPEAEKAFKHRYEAEWPVARTVYQKYYLSPTGEMGMEKEHLKQAGTVSYNSLGDSRTPYSVCLTTQPFECETEFTGHVVAHLNVSATRYPDDPSTAPIDLDLFLSVRHVSPTGTEILYTGTTGDPVPVTKGWLRVSLRKTNHESKKSALAPAPRVPIYRFGNATAGPDCDTHGCGLFEQNEPRDRVATVLKGMNHLRLGDGMENWLLLPEIP